MRPASPSPDPADRPEASSDSGRRRDRLRREARPVHLGRCAARAHAARTCSPRPPEQHPKRRRTRRRRCGAHLPQARRRGPRWCAAGWQPPGVGPLATGSGCGSPPAPSSSTSRSSLCSRAGSPRTCRWTPRTPPRRATLGVRRGRTCGCVLQDGAARGRGSSGTAGVLDDAQGPRWADRAGPIPVTTRVDHLHVRLHGHPEGPVAVRHSRRRRHSSMPRRGCSSRTNRSGRATGCSRGSRWRSTRQCEEDVAGMEARRMPRACPAVAGAHRRRSRPVARGPADHGRLHGADARRRCGRPTRLEDVRLMIFGGEGVPARARRAGFAVEGREVWKHLRSHRGQPFVACAAQLIPDGPVRIGLPPRRPGSSRSSTTRANRVAMGGTGELVIGGVGLARYPRRCQGRPEVRPDAVARLGRGARTAAAMSSAPRRTGCCSSAGPTSR